MIKTKVAFVECPILFSQSEQFWIKKVCKELWLVGKRLAL